MRLLNHSVHEVAIYEFNKDIEKVLHSNNMKEDGFVEVPKDLIPEYKDNDMIVGYMRSKDLTD